MKFQNWRLLGEVVGLTALVLTLAFVAYELRQSNSLARQDARFELHGLYADLHLVSASDPEMAKIIELIASNETRLSEPSEMEFHQIRSFAFYLFNIWLFLDSTYIEGQIEDGDYQGWIADISRVMRMWPGLRPHIEFALRSGLEPEGVTLEEVKETGLINGRDAGRAYRTMIQEVL